jgi:hypothetical protein
MRELRMKNLDDAVKTVSVDDATVLRYGGFGAVFEVAGEPNLLLKRLELPVPEAIGNIPRYLAHIRATRSRLLRIKRDEEESDRPRSFILKCIDDIVDQSLSTHWCFDTAGLNVTAVWFLQKKAPGKELDELFGEIELPASCLRIKIASELVARMRTLRRADLVHLDCIAQNIFVAVDGDRPVVVLIDLDGSGVIRRSSEGDGDEWEHRPFTLGHLNVVRPPPWYPQVRVEANPRNGNYLFAERWVVLDTLIRVLTWNRVKGILSWLDNSVRSEIVSAYRGIAKKIESASSEGANYSTKEWFLLHCHILNELAGRYAPLPPFRNSEGYPDCVEHFADLAQRAYFDPRVLSNNSGGSFYDLYERWLRS